MSNKIDKIWQVLPQISEDLKRNYSDIHPVILQLLFNRGLKEEKDIKTFLDPEYDKACYDPFLFKDMDKAVDIIIGHIKERHKICIYGDYDADGVTASAVLTEVLRTLKADTTVYIPDRVTEGYGLNKNAIEEIQKMGARLIITVDGGIRSKAEIVFAKSLGLDVIVSDHHVPPDNDADLPDCPVINPAVKGEKYPFRALAGVGVAFKLAKAVISRSKISSGEKTLLEEKVIDLVAVGTVADCVTVLGENRALIRRGLEVLNQKRRKGLHELINAAQINGARKLDSWNIGFQIAPRLNAAGRMDHANTAFELLVTNDRQEAAEIASKLNERNADRQKVTEEISAQVDAQVQKEDRIIIGVCPESVENESWKEGVIGLVAGRITEKYYRPTLVITRSEEGLKGSGRSIEEFNIVEALGEAKEALDRFGGHPAACGFSLKPENLPEFMKKMREVAERKLAGFDLRPKLKIEAVLRLSDANRPLSDKLELLGPFGQNNDKPRFVSYAVSIVDINKMGFEGQHIKFKIKDAGSGLLNAIGFGQAEKWKDLSIGDKIDMVYYMENNEFNGRTETQLKIIDIKKNNG